MEQQVDTLAKPQTVNRAEDKPNNPNRVWKKWTFPANAGGFTMVGYSRAADRTFLHIPELKISLDAGHCRGRQTDHVFVTHTHMDHVKDIAYMCKKDGATIHCPRQSETRIANYVRSEFELDWNCTVDLSTMNFKISPHDPGESFEFGKGTHVAKTFQCFHKVPCIGYAFEEKKKRLKQEFVGLAGKELGRLRKEGVQIEEEANRLLFAYVGDTNTTVFTENPWLFNYPVIITECTFLYDEDEGDNLLEKAEKDGHTHWEALAPVVLSHPETVFVLIHFSLRYSEQDIYAFFDKLIKRDTEPLNLANIVVFVGDHTEGRKDK